MREKEMKNPIREFDECFSCYSRRIQAAQKIVDSKLYEYYEPLLFRLLKSLNQGLWNGQCRIEFLIIISSVLNENNSVQWRNFVISSNGIQVLLGILLLNPFQFHKAILLSLNLIILLIPCDHRSIRLLYFNSIVNILCKLCLIATDSDIHIQALRILEILIKDPIFYREYTITLSDGSIVDSSPSQIIFSLYDMILLLLQSPILPSPLTATSLITMISLDTDNNKYLRIKLDQNNTSSLSDLILSLSNLTIEKSPALQNFLWFVDILVVESLSNTYVESSTPNTSNSLISGVNVGLFDCFPLSFVEVILFVGVSDSIFRKRILDLVIEQNSLIKSASREDQEKNEAIQSCVNMLEKIRLAEFDIMKLKHLLSEIFLVHFQYVLENKDQYQKSSFLESFLGVMYFILMVASPSLISQNKYYYLFDHSVNIAQNDQEALIQSSAQENNSDQINNKRRNSQEILKPCLTFSESMGYDCIEAITNVIGSIWDRIFEYIFAVFPEGVQWSTISGVECHEMLIDLLSAEENSPTKVHFEMMMTIKSDREDALEILRRENFHWILFISWITHWDAIISSYNLFPWNSAPKEEDSISNQKDISSQSFQDDPFGEVLLPYRQYESMIEVLKYVESSLSPNCQQIGLSADFVSRKAKKVLTLVEKDVKDSLDSRLQTLNRLSGILLTCLFTSVAMQDDILSILQAQSIPILYYEDTQKLSLRSYWNIFATFQAWFSQSLIQESSLMHFSKKIRSLVDQIKTRLNASKYGSFWKLEIHRKDVVDPLIHLSKGYWDTQSHSHSPQSAYREKQLKEKRRQEELERQWKKRNEELQEKSLQQFLWENQYQARYQEWMECYKHNWNPHIHVQSSNYNYKILMELVIERSLKENDRMSCFYGTLNNNGPTNGAATATTTTTTKQNNGDYELKKNKELKKLQLQWKNEQLLNQTGNVNMKTFDSHNSHNKALLGLSLADLPVVKHEYLRKSPRSYLDYLTTSKKSSSNNNPQSPMMKMKNHQDNNTSQSILHEKPCPDSLKTSSLSTLVPPRINQQEARALSIRKFDALFCRKRGQIRLSNGLLCSFDSQVAESRSFFSSVLDMEGELSPRLDSSAMPGGGEGGSTISTVLEHSLMPSSSLSPSSSPLILPSSSSSTSSTNINLSQPQPPSLALKPSSLPQYRSRMNQTLSVVTPPSADGMISELS